MKTKLMGAAVLLMCLVGLQVSGRHVQKSTLSSLPSAGPKGGQRARLNFDEVPLQFIPNQGQIDGDVAFYVQGRDKTIYFTPEGLTFILNGTDDSRDNGYGRKRSAEKPGPESRPYPEGLLPEKKPASRWIVKLDFIGLEEKRKPTGQEKTGSIISFFKGKPEEWKSGISAYSKIIYRDLWPGIDLAYYGSFDRMKYEFIVHPGADPSRIRLAYRGIDGMALTPDGRLRVDTPLATFEDDVPMAYQDRGGVRTEIPVAYAQAAESGDESVRHAFGFKIGEYDRSRVLVLDPAVLIYCGFLGGAGDDRGTDIAVDGSGNAYVTGYTTSVASSFPIQTGPDLVQNGNTDAFVAKVNAAGTGLEYCGYIGGAADDYSEGIAVDASGNAYITGETNSTEDTFPAIIGPDLTYNGGDDDAFVAKVNASGTSLEYCGYIGGNIFDWGSGIAVDGSGNAFIVGCTFSTENTFPVMIGPDLSQNDSLDAFVAKVNSDGTGLAYCGFLGGSDYDWGVAIDLDSYGNAYITGETMSTESTFPVSGGPDLTYNGYRDAFVAKISSSGTGIVYCGYVGGSDWDVGIGISVDEAGAAYITGSTSSTESTFPVTIGPDLTANGEMDGFVAKVNQAGSGLVYCGYIGGSDRDAGNGIASGPSGSAYVSGYTYSTESTFPVANGPGLVFNGGTNDAFVARVNADGTALDYCTYIGGEGNEVAYNIAVNDSGDAYVVGVTNSTEATFPAMVGPDLTMNGAYDAFLAKIAFYPQLITVTSPNGGEVWSRGTTRRVTWTPHVAGDVTLDLYKGGALFSNIGTAAAESGWYLWNIPGGQTPDVDYSVRIWQEGIEDYSDAAFGIISNAPVIVTSPNGGEVLLTGSSFEIGWSTTGLIEAVKIEYSADAGQNWMTVAESAPNTGSFLWTAPGGLSRSGLIRVSDSTDANWQDMSDSTFVIGAPFVVISGSIMIDMTEGYGAENILISGLPGEPRTDASGNYSATVPSGWSGTVTPIAPGYSFYPETRTYENVVFDCTGQDYSGTYVGGTDDVYEDNDDWGSAATLPLGTTVDLVYQDEDWFRFYVPAESAGKDLRIHVRGLTYPYPRYSCDLDFYVLDGSGRTLSCSWSSSPDELANICGISEGWYYVGVTYASQAGTVYVLTAEIGDGSGIGYIAGRVTDESGNGIEGILVNLYHAPYVEKASRPVMTTNGEGYYRIGFTPGDYQIGFNNESLSTPVPAWVPDMNYIGKLYKGGEIVTLTEGTPLENIDVELTRGGTIRGTVLDASGNPVANGVTMAYSSDVSQYAYARTDAAGKYHIGRLTGRNFALLLYKSPLREWFDNQISFGTADPIGVSSGETINSIDAVLEEKEAGGISGRVTDTGGNPISGSLVDLYDPAGIYMWWRVRTGTTGQYAFSYVPAGAWKVYFNAPSVSSLVSEYYPDAKSLGEAECVIVQAGQITAGIDAALAAGGGISGEIINNGGQATVTAFDTASDYAQTVELKNATTSYTIKNIPPGNYRIQARPLNHPGMIAQWYPAAACYADASSVTVSAGETTSGVNISFGGGGGWISGRVTNGSGAGVPGVTVCALDGLKPALNSSAVTDDDGDYAIRQVPAGQAKVYFDADKEWLGYYSAYYGGTTEYGEGATITVTEGATTSDINAALAVRPTVGVTTSALTAGEIGVSYAQTLACLGGRALYRWSIISGSLPDGLTMNGKGAISGVPTATGTFEFVIRVTDSTSPQQAATQSLYITIGPYTGPGHTVSGSAMYGGVPLPGVTLEGLPGNPVTNASGAYAVVVPDGWTGTVTPRLTGYAFVPAVRTYSAIGSDLSSQDYAAVNGIVIAGVITVDGVGLSGVTLSDLPGDPVTTSSGTYSMAVPIGWSGTVTPTLAGYTFEPTSRSYVGISADLPAEDYAAALILATITVTSPNGGEALTAGTTQEIAWLSTGTITDVKIEYSSDNGGNWLTIIESTSNTGTYSWTVPSVASRSCLVRISDAANAAVFDVSDAVFQIIVKEDLVATWDGQGVYYRNSDTGKFVKIASPATMIAAGDLDGDGIDDLIGLWPGQGGIWVRYSESGAWTRLSSTAVHIAAGDMNGDGRKDLLGTWDGQGVYYRNSISGVWVKMASPATMITTGDIDGDGIDDFIGIWPSQGGVWVKYSSSGTWARLSSTAQDIAAGDMNGDGRDDLLATWEGQGVYYRNSISGVWVKLASQAEQVTCGDLDADGTEDLIGIWPTQGGVWVKYSETGAWARISSSARDIAAGVMRAQGAAGALPEASPSVMMAAGQAVEELSLPMGGREDGPDLAPVKRDLSESGPGGARFIYIEDASIEPTEDPAAALARIPGPGEPGFVADDQKNLIPNEKTNDRVRNDRREPKNKGKRIAK